MNEEEAIARVEKYIKSFNGNALDCVAIGTVLTLLKKKDGDSIEEYKTTYTERCIDMEVREKINELIRKVNQLDKQIKELNK